MLEYTNTDQQLHRLSQVIAKVNRTFVSAKEDDSHTNLAFDSLGYRIMGRWILGGNENVMLTFNLRNQLFEWVNQSQKVLASVKTKERHISEIESELALGLPSLGLDPKGFVDKLHYEIPAYAFMNDPVPEFYEEDLEEWANYRLLANEACNAMLTTLGLESEVRIWPHHFDTGIYVTVNENLGVGFGLAMEDQMAGDPYFYMSGYPSKGEIDYTKVNDLPFGRWETSEYWNGAIMPLSELEEAPHAGSLFMITALKWFLNQ